MTGQVTTKRYYIGTSGWHYDHWRDDFYPKDLAKLRWLEFYSSHFSTVEINNSFYRLPSEAAFINWRNSSPPGFIFSVKVSRFITHIKRLKNTEELTTNFMAHARLLEEKLGPLLYQLPKNLKRDDQLLKNFIQMLPNDLIHIFEFRHHSWFDDEVYNLLRKYKAGLCIYDMPSFNTPIMATSDIAYIRFHGSYQLYGGFYSDKELEEWTMKIASLDAKAIFIYFNNDIEGFATSNALTLRNMIGAYN